MNDDKVTHPHTCGVCERAVAPFRSVLDGSQCSCKGPASLAPVPDGNICFYTRDVPAAVIAIDEQAQLKGLDVISELKQRIGALESSLAFLTGFVDGDPLAEAIVGSLGIRATEMQQQIPALRQAILDIPLMDRSRS